MSSKKVKNNSCKALLCLIAMLLPFIILGCSSGIRDDYLPSNGAYNAVPYVTPVQQPVRQPQYQAPYNNQYQPYYYGAPNSRSYYNPYEFQQPYGRNPYSDYDQYYVPPVQYYNNESPGSQQEGKNVSIFSGKS